MDHAAVFADPRFLQALTWHTPFDLTFYTHRYFEGRNRSLGFEYLLLAPLGLAAAFVIKRRRAAGAAVVSVGGALIVLKLLPNARYLYPSLPLMLVPLAALLGPADARPVAARADCPGSRLCGRERMVHAGIEFLP